ncbi:uncharacterized protein LOC127873415 isoform X2 [Dreissena polymorpha]|uniref:Uncharacterized protein n=1 Tax=Dreissena polymorpha TaxID=45954 RepID=A0A9D4KXA6_DREPO|nr:uncharacterized protein LOC127873415 isoform X2 [Dreissena polymorpha]KAH3846867.1 hypothetical protein DPMN_089174 [Dreissena polymorpha]
MVQCAAFGCKERPGKGNHGFFSFPSDDITRKKWIKAVHSRRIIDGKVVDFKPSKCSKLCSKHFEDSCFVHPPSVMASVGMEFRLLLKAGAFPTIFPETDKYKASKKRPLNPNDLGPVKQKREKYGAFAKRNQKPFTKMSSSKTALQGYKVSENGVLKDFKIELLDNPSFDSSMRVIKSIYIKNISDLSHGSLQNTSELSHGSLQNTSELSHGNLQNISEISPVDEQNISDISHGNTQNISHGNVQQPEIKVSEQSLLTEFKIEISEDSGFDTVSSSMMVNKVCHIKNISELSHGNLPNMSEQLNGNFQNVSEISHGNEQKPYITTSDNKQFAENTSAMNLMMTSFAFKTEQNNYCDGPSYNCENLNGDDCLLRNVSSTVKLDEHSSFPKQLLVSRENVEGPCLHFEVTSDAGSTTEDADVCVDDDINESQETPCLLLQENDQNFEKDTRGCVNLGVEFQRWSQLKHQNNCKSHHAFAKLLLDKFIEWEDETTKRVGTGNKNTNTDAEKSQTSGFIMSGEETTKHGGISNKNSSASAVQSKTSGSSSKKSPYVGCTLSGLPIMQAFKAQFTEPTGGSVSQRCGIFLIVPFVPATGSNVVDMTPLLATREAVVDSSVYLRELMSDKAVIENEHIDATIDNKNLERKCKQDIINKKDLDDLLSDTLTLEAITDATSMTLQAPNMNNWAKKRKRKMSTTFEDPKCEISDENPYLGLNDKECDFELSDENSDSALSDKEGQSINESCQKEMKLLENFIQNKSKVRYLDEEDEKLDKKFEFRRKSTRLRSKGYRPDFKALELPDDSDEETNDKHFGDLAKNGSSEDDIIVDDITDTKMSETEEDPDFEISDENPDFGASDKESDTELSEADPDFQLQLNSEDDELFESRDYTIKQKVVSSKNPCARKVPKVKKKKIMIETCVGITDDMKMKLKSELKWKSIKLEDHADKYTVVKVPSVSQKDRNLDVFEELFSCLVCKGFKAQDKTAFEEHIEEHVNGILRCRICDYESNNQADVKKHQKDAHPNLTKRLVVMGYSCELCGVEFTGLEAYRNHMAKQHNEARWNCSQCETVCFKQSELKKHKCEVHPEIMAYCKKCKLRFLDMTKECYEQHVANCQGASEDNVKRGGLCPDCGKLYFSDLTRHIKQVHSNIRYFQCPKCSYTAYSSSKIKYHMGTHDGIKPHKCDQCAMSFVQPSQLTSHMRTHTGTKPFKCDLCSYAAAWNVQLKEHRGIHGLPTSIKCVACNVLFKNARMLNAHTKKEHPS